MVKFRKVTLGSDASPTEILSAQVEAHRSELEKTYLAKSDTWQGAHSKLQAAQDQQNKYDQRVNNQKRAQGINSFNSDGSMSFLSGFSSESHLRQPIEVIRELLRYIESDMLKLRQSRIEGLLTEFIESMNHDILIGKYIEGSSEIFQLRQNLWAAQSVSVSLNRRHGLLNNKAELVRKMVSWTYSLALIKLHF